MTGSAVRSSLEPSHSTKKVPVCVVVLAKNPGKPEAADRKLTEKTVVTAQVSA